MTRGAPTIKTMSRLLVAGALILLVWAWLPHRSAFSQQMREVFVSNFPTTQQVIGNITIEEPIPATKAVSVTEVVSPIKREETVHLIEGGMVEADGFTTLTLTVYGWMKSGTFQAGEIGVMLLPDEEVFARALDDASELLMPIEVTAAVSPDGGGYFAAQETYNVGFERYRILLYNSSTKSAETFVKVYLGQ